MPINQNSEESDGSKLGGRFAISHCQLRPSILTLQYTELSTKYEVLCQEVLSGSKKSQDGSPPEEEKAEHREHSWQIGRLREL
jgi:hypothetical protein